MSALAAASLCLSASLSLCLSRCLSLTVCKLLSSSVRRYRDCSVVARVRGRPSQNRRRQQQTYIQGESKTTKPLYCGRYFKGKKIVLTLNTV